MMDIREIIEHDVEQGSPEWWNLRVGKITNSTFPALMPTVKQKKGDWSAGQLTILRKVAAEILTGEYKESGSSRSTEHGHEWEPMARSSFSDHIMMPIRSCGFFEYSPMIGGSPDGIIGDMNGVLEIKCPDSQTHILYLNDKKAFWKEYGWQVIGHMLVTGIESGFLVSFDPRFPSNKRMAICEPPKGYKDDIKRLEDRLTDACVEIARMIA